MSKKDTAKAVFFLYKGKSYVRLVTKKSLPMLR